MKLLFKFSIMKAIGLYEAHATDHPDVFYEADLPLPSATGKDLLVKVKAIGVNPVDTKVRKSATKKLDEIKVLGWDAVGVVEAIGNNVSLFEVGDEVFYAGSITRPGSNSDYHLVDERIVGKKPKSLSNLEAAAMPLTTITAWEALFERLLISPKGESSGQSILIIGGAGGVGSVATQLAKQLAKLNVIATASRKETVDWCKQMGADECINHHEDLAEQLKAIGYETVDYVLCLNSTDSHWEAIAQIIKPQGKICTIVENTGPLAQSVLKQKSATHVWELMFTKSMYETEDMQTQHDLLNQAADLFDAGILKTTLTTDMGELSVENLANAHAQLESGRTIGKIALSIS